MKPKHKLRCFLLHCASAILAHTAVADTYYWDGTSATWNDITNWSTDSANTTPDPLALPTTADDLIFNITGANSVQNITLDADQAALSMTFNTTGATNFRANSAGTTARTLTLNSGGITLASGAGNVTIGDTAETYGALHITMNAAQTWKGAAGRRLTVLGNVDNGGNLLTLGDSTNNGPMSISGAITGSGGITMTTTARVILNNDASNFTGDIAVNGFSGAGIIAFTTIADYGVASSLGAPMSGSISLGTGSASLGRLEYLGTTNSESNRSISIGGSSTSGAGQIFNNGTGTLVFDAATFNTTNGTGNRYLVLDGRNTGSNEIRGSIIDNTSGVQHLTKTGIGTWVLGGNNSYTGTTTNTGGGTLKLNYDTTAFGTNSSKLSDTGALTFSGGTLVLAGNNGTPHEEVLGSANIANNSGNFLKRESGSNAVINLNNLTPAGSAGTNQSTLSIGEENMAKTDRLNTNDILGAWFTVGSHWATNSTNAADGLITAYSGYTIFDGTASNADVNFKLDGGITLGAAILTNTLRIEGTSDDQVLDINSRNLTVSNLTGANAVAGTSGGLLYAGGANGNYTITGTTGRLTCENPNGQALLLHTYSGTLNVNALLHNSGSALVKAGAGTLVLGANNTYTGATRVYEGVLRLNHDNAAGTIAGGIIVQNGAVVELMDGIDIGADALTITGTGISNGGALRSVTGATSSYAGAIALGGGGSRINSDSGSSLTLTGGVTTTGAGVTFGGAGNTIISTTAISGASSVTKDGAGTLTFSANNTYTGATIISGGTLAITGATLDTNGITFTAGSLGLDTGGTVTAANAAVNLANGTIKVTGTTGDASYTLLTAASITGTPVLAEPVPGYELQVSGNQLLLVQSGPSGPIDHFTISAISSPQTVGTPITGITLTARDASNLTVTSFTGTVTFSGSGGFTGTSANFTGGVLSGVSVTPMSAGSNLTFVVTDDVSGKTGSQTITTIQTQYQGWSLGVPFDGDANGDGVLNGIAFLLGATSPNVSALNKVPAPEEVAGDLKLTFQMLPASARGSAALSLEHSTTLASDSWTTIAVPETSSTVSDVVFTITGTNPLNVTATIPASKAAAGKLFGRLKATYP